MTPSAETTPFRPIRLLEIDLGSPVSALAREDPAREREYERALALVRLHGQLLGIVGFELPTEGLSATAVAAVIWEEVGDGIVAHMADDHEDRGPAARALTSATLLDGLPSEGALCIRERVERLERAPFVSVVIPTRDRPETLMACLRTLFALEYPNYEIVVVDNAPKSTATKDLIAGLKGERAPVRYVREDRPGLSNAKNRGFAEARGEIVAFTDDDVLVDTLWLAALVRGFGAARNVACVTGMIFPIELETAPQFWIEQFGGFSKGVRRRVFDADENRPPGILFPYAAGMFGSGAAMALHVPLVKRLRSVVRWGGPFDSALGAGTPAMGGEDLAICFDVLKAGYAISYEPSAIVRHGHRREYEGLKQQVYGYGVGLTAFVVKTVADRPLSLFSLMWKLPFGLVYALHGGSGKNVKKRGDYPGELTMLERRGMLYGPLAYVKSRHRARRLARRSTTRESAAATTPAEVA